MPDLTDTFNDIFAFLLRMHEQIWGDDYSDTDPGEYPQRIVKQAASSRHLSDGKGYVKLVYMGHRKTETFPVMTLQIRYFGADMEPTTDLENDTRHISVIDLMESIEGLICNAGVLWVVLQDTVRYINLQAFNEKTVDGSVYAMQFDVRYG